MFKLPVCEIFGPTIQGEGLYSGHRTMFIRMAGCDYRCSWCDTQYAQSVSQAQQLLSEEEIVHLVNKRSCGGSRRVTVTGGNPCIHDLDKLIGLLHQENYVIHIETQGSIIPPWLYNADHVCLSPKPPSSGNVTPVSAFDKFMHSDTSKELKLVVGTEEDYIYAKQIYKQYPSYPFTLQACTKEDPLPVLKWLIEYATADPDWGDNVKVLPQLHVLIGIK